MSLAEIIARTFCDSDGKRWADLGPTDRHRYFYAGRLAQDRIRESLLDGEAGPAMAAELVLGPQEGVSLSRSKSPAVPATKPH
jgi:hypothetical protein